MPPAHERRKVASSARWRQIIAAKQGPCRCCGSAAANGRIYGRIQFYHLIPRGTPWFGDDLADNIVPLCPDCHTEITAGSHLTGLLLAANLEPDEIAYALHRVGETGFERLYGCLPPRRDAWTATLSAQEAPFSDVPENTDAPCNICGRGWPYHDESCAYAATARENKTLRDAIHSAVSFTYIAGEEARLRARIDLKRAAGWPLTDGEEDRLVELRGE